MATCLFFLVIFHEFVCLAAAGPGAMSPPRWLPEPREAIPVPAGARDRVVTAI